MRIAMLSDSYLPYISGVTRAVSVAKGTLTDMGHQVTLFCPAYPGAVREEGVHRLPSVKAPTNSTYYVALPPFPALRKQIRKEGPDVIHIHSPFNLCRAGLNLGRQLGIPVVFTYHTMYNMYAHYVPLLGRSVSGMIEKDAIRVARKANAVITPSRVLADYLASRGVDSPLYPIPNGIDVFGFQSGDPEYLRTLLNIPQGTKIVLTCSRLGPEKNVETLLRAFAEAAGSVGAVLVLIGDGPQRKFLEGLASSLNIADKVRFMGSMPPEKMPDLYAGADMFLFASLTDTQGLVVVEAKAAGLPAVAVGALGVKDMVKHGDDGFLCENDPHELARRTVELLSDGATLATMKEAARKNASAFSKQASASKLVACYESVIR